MVVTQLKVKNMYINPKSFFFCFDFAFKSIRSFKWFSLIVILVLVLLYVRSYLFDIYEVITKQNVN